MFGFNEYKFRNKHCNDNSFGTIWHDFNCRVSAQFLQISLIIFKDCNVELGELSEKKIDINIKIEKFRKIYLHACKPEPSIVNTCSVPKLMYFFPIFSCNRWF